MDWLVWVQLDHRVGVHEISPNDGRLFYNEAFSGVTTFEIVLYLFRYFMYCLDDILLRLSPFSFC